MHFKIFSCVTIIKLRNLKADDDVTGVNSTFGRFCGQFLIPILSSHLKHHSYRVTHHYHEDNVERYTRRRHSQEVTASFV